MKKMHRTQIYLTEEQHQFLRRRAESEETTISDVIRHLIEQRLPKRKDFADNPLFSIADDSPLEMGRRDGSENHDKYIYSRDDDKDKE